MSYYRDTATALAQRAAGNFIAVVLYVPMGGQSTSPWWSMLTFPRSKALEEWYEEIAPSAPLYYYLAAFDKTRSSLPVGESISPPKPGAPGFDIHSQWRAPPFNKPTIAGEVPSESRHDAGENRGGPVGVAKTIAIFALVALPVGILLSKAQERKLLRAEKAEFNRLGLDWSQRVRY